MAYDERAIRDRVRAMVRDMAGVRPPSVDGSADLRAELGYDSLGLLELAGALEEEFALSMPDDDVEYVETVADVEGLVLDLLARAEAR